MDILFTSVAFEGNLNSNLINITKFSANTLNGSVQGKLSTNLATLKTKTEIILKEISVRDVSRYLKELSLAISGKLSAFVVAQFQGLETKAILNSLDGYVKFNINNGELSQFATLERFLQAGNLVSQRLTLASIISTIQKQNTGDFKTIEGTIKVKNSLAVIQYINTQGTNMAMHIEGRYHILAEKIQLKILGRIPTTIAPSAVEKMASTTISQEKLDKIPSLVNQLPQTSTREFSVLIDGKPDDKSSIKYFNWLY